MVASNSSSRHQCSNLRITSSVSFGDLQSASFVASMANVTICPCMPVSISAIHMRDIEWCIFLVKKENLVLGSHIRKYVCMYSTLQYICTSSRQIGTEAWDKRQANRQAKIIQANRQAFTAYPFPPQLGTCFDWGSSCTHRPSIVTLSIPFLGGPHLDVSVRNTYPHPYVFFN